MSTGLDPRIHTDLAHLRRIGAQARALSFLPRQPARSILNGRHASRLRGRGLNFEELRHYMQGDDIRTIDWKVTARTGEPFVRVYTEERDRPALLLVDQRMSMFFGTQLNMKSVTAAEAAAVAATRIRAQGDRVGGLVFGDDTIAELPPRASQRALHQLLGAIARANCALDPTRIVADPMPLNRPLEAAARIATTGGMILIFSDFDGADEKTERLLRHLAQRNDVILFNVSDPTSNSMPEGLQLVVSDGQLQVQLDTNDGATHRALQDFASNRLAMVLGWARKYQLPVMPLSTAEPTAAQLMRLMGHSRGPQVGGRL